LSDDAVIDNSLCGSVWKHCCTWTRTICWTSTAETTLETQLCTWPSNGDTVCDDSHGDISLTGTKLERKPLVQCRFGALSNSLTDVL